MYCIDDRDCVVEISDVPQSSIGAPCPVLVSDELHLILMYYAEAVDENWDGSYVRVVGVDSKEEPSIKIRFTHPIAHMFGPPNDEAFSGHPLSERGLHPYGVFRIEDSSWIRILMKMNAVHPYHSDDNFKRYNHYIFAFHDSTFECIAESFEWSWGKGSLLMQLAKTSDDLVPLRKGPPSLDCSNGFLVSCAVSS